MPDFLRFSPGNTICWRARRFMVVDYASMEFRFRRTRSRTERIRLPRGKPRETDVHQRIAWNSRVVANTTNPFDSPKPVIVGKFLQSYKRFSPLANHNDWPSPFANNVLRFALNVREP